MNETRGLWRGRGTNTWHYGDLISAESENNHSPMIIDNGRRYSVFPDTLGEYTGLRDKNGKLIFEGDILKYYDDNSDLGLICFGNYGHYPNRDNHRGFYALRNTRKRPIFWDMPEFPVEKLECAEIIGNSFDNPELLKGENDVP